MMIVNKQYNVFLIYIKKLQRNDIDTTYNSFNCSELLIFQK